MRRVAAPLLAALAIVVGCTSAPRQAPGTPTPRPAPTATTVPTAIPPPVAAVDPIAAIVARQAELRTFRQALSLEIVGQRPTGQATTLTVAAEGDSARPNSRLYVRTDPFGAPLAFWVVEADGKLYLNPFGAWLAVDAQSGLAGLPLVPVPVVADPQELLPLLAGGEVVPDVGVPVRGTPTDVLRFTLPPERVAPLAAHLLIPQAVALLEGTPTYTGLSGELAVGREDGFVRRVSLLLRGYTGSDPSRTFSIQSRTELWDVNDPTITVEPPTGAVLQFPSVQLPAIDGILRPGR